MMKVSIFLALVAVAASIDCAFNSYDEIIGLDDVDPIEEANLKKLTPYLIKLSKKIKDKLSNEEARDPANCMKIAEERLDKLTSGCLGACSLLKKTEKKAVELFVSLEDTVGRCDTKSYEILYRNKLVCDSKETIFNLWSFHVTNHYLALHAEHCRPIHRQRFAEKEVPRFFDGSFERLEKSLATLSIYDFGYDGEHNAFGLHNFDLVGMRKPDFTSVYARRSLVKIVEQIAQQLRNSSIPVLAKLADLSQTHEQVKKLLNDYLFEPCVYYRDLFATQLNEARFDAAVADGEAQKEYIYGDKKFHQALITNRLCGSLLEKQQELYEPFYHAWDYMMSPMKFNWRLEW